MLVLYPGARVLGLRPELIVALMVSEGAYREVGVECVLRHGIEGTHMRGSPHYAGLAVDLRIRNVPGEKRFNLVARIRAALGADYDVLWEAQGTENEHLHIEYDPKDPY